MHNAPSLRAPSDRLIGDDTPVALTVPTNRPSIHGITPWSGLALAVVAFFLIAPQSPPTADLIASGQPAPTLWSLRAGPVNLLEVMAVVLALASAAPYLVEPARSFARSALDPILVLAVSLGVAVQAVALLRGFPTPRYVPTDVERPLTMLAGYFLVTRSIHDPRTWRIVSGGLAVLLGCAAAEVVLVHGVIGHTQFFTAQGREALLITEDSLLLIVPAAFACGMLVERRTRGLLRPAALVLIILAAAAVDAFSLRRGALIALSVVVVTRACVLPRRALASLIVGVAILGAAVALIVPQAPVVRSVSYAVRSATGGQADASTAQRSGERRDFARNVTGASWLVGKGMGSPWNAYEPGPREIASYGSGETAFIRLGWHATGLDWLYKFGLGGVAVILTLLFVGLRRGWLAARAHPCNGTAMRSLVVVCPVLLLFSFTNIRIAFVSGLVLALISTGIDLNARRSPAPSA